MSSNISSVYLSQQIKTNEIFHCNDLMWYHTWLPDVFGGLHLTTDQHDQKSDQMSTDPKPDHWVGVHVTRGQPDQSYYTLGYKMSLPGGYI